MDVVYLVRQGENPELRMSLRSLRNYRNLDRVWIFGGCPEWVTNVNHVATPQDGNKHHNTNWAMRAACQHPGVSDPFVYMNDDMYFMEAIDAIPTLNRGTIAATIAWYHRAGVVHSRYVRGMRNTLRYLKHHGFDNPLSFELHTPMVIRKKTMLAALDRGPYQRRTVYGALAGLTGDTVPDPKVTKPGQPIPEGPFLSTMDDTFPYVRPFLEAAFPDPSPYEAIEGAAAA